MENPFEASDLRSYVARVLTCVGIPEITAENLRQVIHRNHVWELGVGYAPRPGCLVPSDYEGLIGLTALLPHEKTVTEFHAALIKAMSKDADEWMRHNADEIDKLVPQPARVDFRKLDHRAVTFEQLAAIDWTKIPVDGPDHQDARYFAGLIRGFDEFYKNNEVQRDIETWLTNYSATHAYRPEN